MWKARRSTNEEKGIEHFIEGRPESGNVDLNSCNACHDLAKLEEKTLFPKSERYDTVTKGIIPT